MTSAVGVTYPRGFRASGVAAGLKASGDLDVALVVNDGPSSAASGVLTRNRVHAAPVRWTRQVLQDGSVRAVVLNSGGANACTGARGEADTAHTAEYVANLLDMAPADVAVCSTGVIGEYLPVGKLLVGIEAAAKALSCDGGTDAAAAIMTTDTVTKQAELSVGGIRVGGMAKGAGMLAPELATMLAVLTTDALVESEQLAEILSSVAAETFERVDSDGCMSTNDTVLLLASGASETTAPDDVLGSAVLDVASQLSRQLVADAEGASKDISVEVIGASTTEDALVVGRAVARSNLFKCAVHGEDPNWGRVLSAVGTTSAEFDPNELAVAMNGIWVARDGAASQDRALVDLSGRDVSVVIDLGAGIATATVWTNDLTAAYVHENSAYSS